MARRLREIRESMSKPANPCTEEYQYNYLWEKLGQEKLLSALENPCSQGKKMRTWSNRTELSLREKQYQLLYRWSRTAIALLTSFQNREKQSFNLCPRTGSVHNVAKRERQIEACPVAALHHLPPLRGHFYPMWSTKWTLKLSLLIILGYGTSYSMGLSK